MNLIPGSAIRPGGWVNPKDIVYDEDIPIPSVEGLIVEDGEPVESVYIEKLMRLLTEPLYSSWQPGFPFVALANVGLFAVPKNPALAPDVMLSTRVDFPENLHQPKHRSYFVWEYGKPPDVIVEMVSDKRGGEDYYKAKHYAQIAVPYYVIFDPLEKLKKGALRAFERLRGVYRPLRKPWFEDVGLGLTLWTGQFERWTGQWLRWCEKDGTVIPTGKEFAEKQKAVAEQQKAIAKKEKARAKQERQQRERLEAHLRSLGIDPSTLT
jgi:hypothetical protein